MGGNGKRESQASQQLRCMQGDEYCVGCEFEGGGAQDTV